MVTGQPLPSKRDVSPIGHALGAALVCVALVVVVVLVRLEPHASFERPVLLAVLNTVFLSLIPGWIAIIAARAYLEGGGVALLWLGSGSLSLGLSSLLAGWVMGIPGSPNPTVTLHNCGALLSALLHLVGALGPTGAETPEPGSRRRRLHRVAAIYALLVLAISVLSAATLSGEMPLFFVDGEGPTILRQGVLAGALALFSVSTLAILGRYLRVRSAIFFWYGVGLALVTVGLGAVFLERAVGGVVSWVGRGAQYLGVSCFLWASFTAARWARAQAMSLDQAVAFFVAESDDHYRALNAELERRVARRTQQLADANRRLTDALREKETLVKEVHHRVKNNLQVMISLLALQIQQTEDPRSVTVLRDSQERLRAMALVHEHLYRSPDLSRVDMGRYVYQLAKGILDVFQRGSDVTLEVCAEGVRLSVDAAIPCGLILNELVSNALKHAFPEGRRGRIVVALSPAEDGALCLSVSDDGIGLPDAVDSSRPSTLGLRLLNILARQLRAILSIHRGNGTRFEVTFHEPEDRT